MSNPGSSPIKRKMSQRARKESGEAAAVAATMAPARSAATPGNNRDWPITNKSFIVGADRF